MKKLLLFSLIASICLSCCNSNSKGDSVPLTTDSTANSSHKVRTIQSFLVPDDLKPLSYIYAPFTGEMKEIVDFQNERDGYHLGHKITLKGEMTGEHIQVISFSNDTAYIVSEGSWSSIGGSLEDNNRNCIYLILPEQDSKALWKYRELNGDEFLCTSELIKGNYKGTSCLILKVTKEMLGSEQWANSIDYYVEGKGFWKETNMSGEVFITLSTK